MNNSEIQNLLQQKYNRDNWIKLLNDIFNNVNVFTKPKEILPIGPAKKIMYLGNVELNNNKHLAFIEVEVKSNVQLYRNRVALRNLTVKLIDQDVINGVLVIYYKPDENNFRFSFIAKKSEFTEKGDLKKTETHPKRYTYILGKNESCTTAAQRFSLLAYNDNLFIELKDVLDAFNVEKLSKEFFKEYKEFYNKFIADILSSKSKIVLFKDEKHIRDFVKKMLGRIIFLYFVQKKGWLGASDTKYVDGDYNFIQNLFIKSGKSETFYPVWLNKLFFDTLNNRRDNESFEMPNGRKVKIPYLNGGLFEKDENDSDIITFKAKLFDNLFQFLARYNFTIYEDSPEEQTVAVDPEMLGHIFENLLEDNKDKGAFYTPKEIVHYMTQESLIEYLHTHLPNLKREELVYFVKEKDLASGKGELNENLLEIHKLLSTVKICDPAIGSGAFPMGLLQEIFTLKELIQFQEGFKIESPAKLKESIIQNSIYGVDIEQGAVDIARLRFWLSLVVDEEKPKPLPNLDYKIMQGNSLLESYGGIDLSKNTFLNNTRIKIYKNDLFLEPEDEFNFGTDKKKEIENLIKKYFSIKKPSEKLELHKKIDGYVIEYIDKSLEFYENRLTIEIETYKDKIKRKTNGLNTEQKKIAIPKLRETKEIAIREEKLKNKNDARKELLSFEKTNEHPYFLWHLYFMDVLEKGGFDIVIGNPPYIQLQKAFDANRKFADLYKNEDYKTFERTGDIYALFYEKGIDILAGKGLLCFITSNKWMRANYGKSLRKFLSENNPFKLIDLGPGVFNTATVDTNILLIQKIRALVAKENESHEFTNKNKELQAITFTQNNKNDIAKLTNNDFTTLTELSEESWIILSPDEQTIKQKIERIGTPLKDWEININYGIKTGYNEAFIIDSKIKDELIAKDPKSAEIIKPILRGRDIKRYKAEFADLWLIATFPALNLNIDEYPAVKEYLKSFGKRLHQTGEIFIDGNGNKIQSRKKTGNKWFETQDQIAYYEEFEKEKIVYQEIVRSAQFYYDNNNYFPEATTFILTGQDIKYLISILNSKPVELFFKKYYAGGGLGGNGYRYKKAFLINLPINKITKTQQQPFIEIVDKIIAKKEKGKDITTEEQKIDIMVYKLYELTYAEVLIVQPNFAEIMSKKEYDEFEVGSE